ncbi:hypothetical protein [Hymenobacter sp. HDW8]|nr:hypothetical protein [Hymenobacter sp. HDW8]QIL74764.1 hypothetical protein G7064_01980 [Hymenobacter sp. HDW8]
MTNYLNMTTMTVRNGAGHGGIGFPDQAAGTQYASQKQYTPSYPVGSV